MVWKGPSEAATFEAKLEKEENANYMKRTQRNVPGKGLVCSSSRGGMGFLCSRN